MPALIPKAFTEHDEPFVWVCSDCDKQFSTTQLPNPSMRPNILGINRDFAQHCRRSHPKAVIVELPQPGGQKTSLVDALFGWLRIV